MSDLTPASIEVLASLRDVIEQTREMAFPDQIGKPIPQDAMARLLALAEEQAVERYLAATPAPALSVRDDDLHVLEEAFGYLRHAPSCPYMESLRSEDCDCGFTAYYPRYEAAYDRIAATPAPAPDVPPADAEHCPFCGAPGRYVTADEGTSYFQPTPAPAPDVADALRQIRDAEKALADTHPLTEQDRWFRNGQISALRYALLLIARAYEEAGRE